MVLLMIRPRLRSSIAVICAAAALTCHGGAPGIGLSTAGAATPAVGTSWPRPPLSNPIVIRLHVGADSLHLNDSRDYALRMPPVKKLGPLVITGGRNVRIVGGLMSTKIKGPNIVIMDNAGTHVGRIVHIEGVTINGSSRVPSDGIMIKAPKTIVQLENDRIVGLWGTLSGYHADVVQPGGGVKELRIDGLTGSSHYNNFYFRRETNPLKPAIGRVIIRNANMFGYDNSTIPRTTLRGISIGTQGNPPSDDSLSINCAVSNPLILTNFWVTPPKGVRPAQFVYPHDQMAGAAAWCHSAYASSTHSVDWPNLRASKGGPVSGVVRVGTHRAFVPRSLSGLNYR
ncbi:MAG: hypothetical protein QOG33_1722 [Gaiellales bacterium]|jgi:hypothetical protein|nr:hypothetical protein [Gaiellales bacterium]